MRNTLVILVCAFGVPLCAAEYYVAPNGNDANLGTFAAPWALTKICQTPRRTSANPHVSAGDIVWLRGGLYATSAPLFCDLIGTSGSRITVAAYPGETPIIEGQHGGVAILHIGGSYLTIRGITIRSNYARVSLDPGSNPANVLPNCVDVNQQGVGNPTGVVLANITAYACDSVISATSSDYATQYKGIIAFDIGRDAADRLHGGPVYAQNNATNGDEIHSGIMLLNNPWYHNYRVYTTSGTANSIKVRDSVVIGGDNYIQTLNGPITGFEWTRNVYAARSRLNSPDSVNGPSNPTYTDSLWYGLRSTAGAVHGVAVGFQFDSVTFTGNTTISGGPYFSSPSSTFANWTIDNNAHYVLTPTTGNTSARSCIGYANSQIEGTTGPAYNYITRPFNNGGYPVFWPNRLGSISPNSTCVDGPPTSNITWSHANADESGRGHVVVLKFNANTTTQVVSVSWLLEGDRWEALDAWNLPAGPVASGVYDGGGTITLPLSTAAGIYGESPTACWHTDRANCLTSGDYNVVAASGDLPAQCSVGQFGLISSTYRVWRCTGNAWQDTGASVTTHAGPVRERLDDVFAYLVRRKYDGRAETVVAWGGSISDTVEAGYDRPSDGGISWGELPANRIACSDGRCTGRIPQGVGDAWWRINGGPAMKMAAR